VVTSSVRPRSQLKRWLVRLAATTLALGVIIHLPPVMGYLAAHGHHGGGVCPLGYGQPVSHVAHRALPAHARPALGFALEHTTAADVSAWADANHVTCSAKHGGTLLECTDLPSSAVPGALAVTSAWLQFADDGTLAQVTTTRRDRDVSAVSGAFAAIEDDVTRTVGAPTTASGSATPEVLSHGTLRQAMVEYKRADYHAVLRATNMGNGYVLTEQYATL
jgi:hypothetical protein